MNLFGILILSSIIVSSRPVSSALHCSILHNFILFTDSYLLHSPGTGTGIDTHIRYYLDRLEEFYVIVKLNQKTYLRPRLRLIRI